MEDYHSLGMLSNLRQTDKCLMKFRTKKFSYLLRELVCYYVRL